MNKKDIENKVIKLLVEKYMQKKEVVEDNKDENLFLILQNFSERELVNLFFDIEDIFQINIDANEIVDNYVFSTISGMVSCIENSLKIVR